MNLGFTLALFVKMFERFVGSCVDRSKLKLNWRPTDCDSFHDKNSQYFWLRNDSSFAVIDAESNNKLIEHHFHSNNESLSQIICITSCFIQSDNSKPSTSEENDQNILFENEHSYREDVNENFGLYIAVRHISTSKNKESIVLYCFDLESARVYSSLSLDFEPTSMLVLKDARFRRGNSRLFKTFDDFRHIILLGSKSGKLFLCNPDWSSVRDVDQDNVEPFHLDNIDDLSPDWDPKITFCVDILSFAKNDDFFYWSSFNNRFNIPLKDIVVSSLYLLNAANFVVVGFNLGTFMILSASNFQPLFLSEYGSVRMPVRRFEYQEPENDPRAILYLWVIRNSSSRAHFEMHQMCFSDKNAHNSYEKFEFCVSRFNFSIENCIKVLSAQTLEIQASGHNISLSDDHIIDRNLFYVTWLAFDSSLDETGRYYTKSSANERLKGAVFDLNGWYYAQMPRRFDLHGEKQFSAPKNRRQVDFLVVHDFGCWPNLNECCLAVETMTDTIERCCYDHAAVYASAIGCQSILITNDRFYDLQIYNLKRQALNYISCGDRPFTENCWLQINDILNDGSIDVQYPDESSLHLIKEQICDTLFNDQNFDVLIKLASILTSNGCDNDVFDQWLWRKSVELKAEFDEYLIAALQNEDTFEQIQKYKRDIQNLSFLFNEWIDVARLKFENSAKDVLEAKKDVFYLVKNYIDMTAFFCKDELKYLALIVNKNIMHSKTALYNSKSLTILCTKIEDVDLVLESFFHLMNVYLRPELTRFAQNFLVYYVLLSILYKLPCMDDAESFKDRLQFYCDEILLLLDENFQSFVELIYNLEQNKCTMIRKCCNFEVILQKCGLCDLKLDDVEAEKLTTEQLKLQSIKLLNTAKENESMNDIWQNVLGFYYDKIGMKWLKSPSLNDDIPLDYSRCLQSDAKIYFSNLMSHSTEPKLQRKSPEPRFPRQKFVKGESIRRLRNLDSIASKIDIDNVSKVKILPSTPFLRKQFRKLERQYFEKEKSEPLNKKSKFDTPKLKIGPRISTSAFKLDLKTKSINQLGNLLKQENLQQIINSPLLKVENFRRKLSALDTTNTSRNCFTDLKSSFLGSSSLIYSPNSSPKPRKSILVDTSISSSARKSNNMTHVKDCTLIKKFRFDLDELFAQDKSAKKVNFQENKVEKIIEPTLDESKNSEEMSLDNDHETTEVAFAEIESAAGDDENKSTKVELGQNSTTLENDQKLLKVHQGQETPETDIAQESIAFDNHVACEELIRVEHDQTTVEQVLEEEFPTEYINQTSAKERAFSVESFGTTTVADNEISGEVSNLGQDRLQDIKLVERDERQPSKTDGMDVVETNEDLVPKVVDNYIEVETSPSSDEVFESNSAAIPDRAIRNSKTDNVNGLPQIENVENLVVNVVEPNFESSLQLEKNGSPVQRHDKPKKSCDQEIQTSFVVICLPKSNNSNGNITSDNRNFTSMKSAEKIEEKMESAENVKTEDAMEEQQPSVSATPKEPAKRKARSLKSIRSDDDSISIRPKPGSPRRKSERISTRTLRSAKRDGDKPENSGVFAEKLRTISRRTDPVLRHMRLTYNLRNKYKDKSSG